MSEWDQISAAFNAAKRMRSAMDGFTGDMADIIAGNLRQSGGVCVETLRKLKRELRDFDMVTGKWKR